MEYNLKQKLVAGVRNLNTVCISGKVKRCRLWSTIKIFSLEKHYWHQLTWLLVWHIFRHYSNIQPMQSEIVVQHNGSVYWVPVLISTSPCTHDEKNHTCVCKLMYGSWTYEQSKMDLHMSRHHAPLFMFGADPSLSFRSDGPKRTLSTYPGWPGKYPDISYTLYVSRRRRSMHAGH